MTAPQIHIKNLTINLRTAPPLLHGLPINWGEFVPGTLEKTEAPRFELSADGATITDHKTGLMWAAGEETRVDDFDAALKLAKDCRLGGFDDWFIPDVDQLQTIVDRSRYSPATFTEVFKSTSNWVFTSTPYAGSSRSGWFVFFNGGLVADDDRGDRAFARPCRVAAPAGQ